MRKIVFVFMTTLLSPLMLPEVAARAQRTSVSSLVETFLGNLSLEQKRSFSDKWLGAFKEPPHQRASALSVGSTMRPGFGRH